MSKAQAYTSCVTVPASKPFTKATIYSLNWNSGQIAINCFQKWKEIKPLLKFKCPWRARLLLQKWPSSRTVSTLHCPLTNLCSGSTREITTKSLYQAFLTAHTPPTLPTPSHCLLASKCTGNSSSPSQRSKLLEFILIYGKYEVCLNKYLTNSVQKNEHKK